MNLKKLIDQIATGDAAGGGSNAEHYMRDHVIYNGNTGEFYNNFEIDDYPEGYQRCTTMYSSNYTSPGALLHEVGSTASTSSPASSSYQKEDSSYVNNCYNDSIHQHLLQQSTHHHLLRQPSHAHHHLVNYSNGSLPVLMQPQHSRSQIIPSNLCQYNGSSSHANAKLANDDDGHHQHHNLNNHHHHQHHHSHLHNDDNGSRKSVINGDNDENDQMDETKLGVDHHYSGNNDDNIVGDNDDSNGGQLFVIKKESLN